MEAVWNAPPTDFILKAEDVHIWRAALDLPSERIQELKEKLAIVERTKAESFRFERDRNRFIVGVGILRTVLGRYLGVEPTELQFCYGKHGKPRLADAFGNKNINFNMSHSESLALYAFTRDHEIGVDIECIRDIHEMDNIAEQFFSIKENDVFRSLPENKKKEAFFNCWTRKEAFIKAIGDGLYQPLDKFDVAFLPGEPARLLSIGGDSKRGWRWLIQDLKPGPGFAAAFAVEGRSWEVRNWQWSD